MSYGLQSNERSRLQIYRYNCQKKMCIELSFEPLTIEKWGDFVSLFGERGACRGCWCMLWRLSRKEFESQKGDTNKLAMKTIVAAG